MSDEDSFWNFGANIDDNNNQVGQSSRNENIFEFLYPCEPAPNFWFQTPSPLITTPPTNHAVDILGYFKGLMDSPTTPLFQPVCAIDFPNIPVFYQGQSTLPPEIGQSSGTINKAQHKKAKALNEKKKKKLEKRIRAAKIHNLSEKKRRVKISTKMNTLKEMIPNCNKTDRASILDNAVNYVQFMKLQIELMSGSTVTPYITPSGLPGEHGPQYSQFLPIMPKLDMGMGLFGMCYPNGVPVLQAPSAASFHPSISGGLGKPLMPGPANLAVPQTQMPCYPSQVQMANYTSGFSPGLNFPSQGDQFTSQVALSIAIAHQQQLQQQQQQQQEQQLQLQLQQQQQ
ncbi:hypothetical protein Dsin_024649 [Dipteronia sinensis]|uniref:BHLH domain-containing protein n=1 Tax=Dipteronia sinensis TaxID=43782 RepID=A0AAE0DXL0_9ROSI|nr:hypothetical protein Dsin_024649 [Dipteronia sinensis]